MRITFFLIFFFMHFQALDKCQLGELVRGKEMKLNSPGLFINVEYKTLNQVLSFSSAYYGLKF